VGFESAVKRRSNNLQSTAGTERHFRNRKESLMDRRWIADGSHTAGGRARGRQLGATGMTRAGGRHGCIAYPSQHSCLKVCYALFLRGCLLSDEIGLTCSPAWKERQASQNVFWQTSQVSVWRAHRFAPQSLHLTYGTSATDVPILVLDAADNEKVTLFTHWTPHTRGEVHPVFFSKIRSRPTIWLYRGFLIFTQLVRSSAMYAPRFHFATTPSRS
jgi:hypothetical protein